MTWTIETIGKFFESKMNSPEEYRRLMADDPVGRMLAALAKAESDFKLAVDEYRSLGTADYSTNPARTAELQPIMDSALATRDCMKASLEACLQRPRGRAGAQRRGHAEPRGIFAQDPSRQRGSDPGCTLHHSGADQPRPEV